MSSLPPAADHLAALSPRSNGVRQIIKPLFVDACQPAIRRGGLGLDGRPRLQCSQCLLRFVELEQSHGKMVMCPAKPHLLGECVECVHGRFFIIGQHGD